MYSKEIKEIDSEDQGLIITNFTTQIVSRVRAREELLFEVGVQNLTVSGGDFVFKVTRMFDSSVVAQAIMGFTAYDYRLNKRIDLKDTLRKSLDSKPFEL